MTLPDTSRLAYEELLGCIRCGACLSVCPTYRVHGTETQSPRGRIAMLRAVAEGVLEPGQNFLDHMYNCLDCRACQSVCPVGIRIGERAVEGRVMMETARGIHPVKRLILRGLIPRPKLMNGARRAARLYQRSGLQALVRNTSIGSLLPGPLGSMEALLTPLPDHSLLASVPDVVPPAGSRRSRVVFFWNCVMNVMMPDASLAAIRVLARNGCEVIIPRDLGCCGALHFDQGDGAMGRRLARRNVDRLVELDADAIVTDAAACGAMTKEYAELLADDPAYADKAHQVSAKVRDITQILADLVPDGPALGPVPERVTYHEACHLAHGQKISRPPRDLLRLIPELDFIELPESNWCCGSAGIYNVTHAGTAQQLLDRKMENLAKTGAAVVVTTNPGCLVQLLRGVREDRQPVRVEHLVQLLDRAYAAAETGTPAAAAPKD